MPGNGTLTAKDAQRAGYLVIFDYGSGPVWSRPFETRHKRWAYLNRGDSYRNLGQYAKSDADNAKACSLDSQYC